MFHKQNDRQVMLPRFLELDWLAMLGRFRESKDCETGGVEEVLVGVELETDCLMGSNIMEV